MTLSTTSPSGDLTDVLAGVRLGKFDLFERIGEGAMGAVYRGYHEEQGLEVAIKVILQERAGDSAYQRAFGHEVRSVAALEHPGIVRLYDYGVIDAGAEARLPDKLRQGSPYLVMEYGRFGTLAGLMDKPQPWPVVELVLFAILDALAHSHARGVIHRDIKPQNVLLDRVEEGWPGVLLTDFGLAYALQPDEGAVQSKRVAGTPQYMAPEQLLGKWREYGPATDLYALGCVIYEMICGEVPFGGDNVMQIARAHLDQPVPRLSSRLEVPEGLDGWMQRMLAKDATARWASAAIAARELRRICAREGTRRINQRQWQAILQANVASGEQRGGEEHASVQMLPFHALTPLMNALPVNEAPAVEQRFTSLPQDWQRPRRSTNIRVAGAGLGLFGLRRLPTVGREVECEQLWSTLREVIEGGVSRAVLLQGASGVGKDHLAAWLVERAREVGSANTLHVRYRAAGEVTDAVRESLIAYLGLEGLSRAEVATRLEAVVRASGGEDPYEWQSMTEMLSPTPVGEGGGLRLSSQAQRHSVLAAFLRRLAQAGPLIVRLQDVQWGVTALGWVELLLHQVEDERAPILVVMSARDDLMALSAEHIRALATLRQSGAFRELSISPLGAAATMTFIEELLFLEPGLAGEVAERCAGNPLVAMTFVERWIERGLLTPTLDGFRFEGSPEERALDDAGSLWLAPALAIVDESGPEQMIALEVAAALGARFGLLDWKRACAAAGIEWNPQVVERLLVRRHLVDAGSGQLAFSQSLLREALLVHLRGAGRWQKLHAACAKALTPRVDAGEEGALERSAVMLKESGQTAEAVRRFLKASEVRRLRGEQHYNAYLLDQAWQALDDVANPLNAELARLRVELACDRAWMFGATYHVRLAQVWALRAVELAEAFGDSALLAQARSIAGLQLSVGSRAEEAEDLLRGAIAYWRVQDGDRRFHVIACKSLARLLARRGQWDEVFVFLDEALVQAEASGDLVLLANVRYDVLFARYRHGDVPTLEELDELIAICELAEQYIGLAEVLNLRADIQRTRGEVAGARADLARALHYFNRINSQNGMAVMLNLGLMLLAEDDVDGAKSYFERAAVSLRRQRRPQLLIYAVLGCLVSALSERHRTRVERLSAEAIRLIEETHFLGDDDARALLLAASRAVHADGERWEEWAQLKALGQMLERMPSAP
ncbi:serine/threonine-protein kinase [Lujinxingia litoralis]|nr:serine/threonine-protein kinase [Lujinxingia litoralis]